MEINFFMPMEKIPTATGQEKGYSKRSGTYYEPDNVKMARAKLNAHLAPHRPQKPLEGPIYLVVRWGFPATETHPANTWKTTRPDTDNLQKILKDEMTKLGFWHDDAQVCGELITKFYAKIPGIAVNVREMEG